MLKLIWRTLFCCFALVVGWSIYHLIIRLSGDFGWDEASHSLKGLLIAHDFKSGDWVSLLYDTYRQVYWPPLHSWLTAISFLVSGPSAISARCVSLIFFLLTALVIYVAALQFGQPRKEVAATVATLLFLTSPPVILSSAQAMLEIPGLFCLSLSVLIHTWLNAKTRSPSAHMWLGVAIVLTYFTKTNYGILLIIVVALSALLSAGARGLFSRQNFYTFLPVAVAFAIWFAYPPKIASTLAALINVAEMEPYSLEGFFYYPKVMLHLWGSIWQSAIPVLALIMAFKYRRNPGIRFLLLLAAIQFGLGQMHHTKSERHIMPMVPALVLVTGFLSAEWWDFQGTAVKRWLPRVAMLVLCLWNATTFTGALRPAGMENRPELVDRVADALLGSNSSLVLGTKVKKGVSEPALDWHLCVEKRILPVTHSGIAMHLDQDRKIWQAVQKRRLPWWLQNELQRVLTRAEQRAQTRSLYVGHPPEASYSRDPGSFGAFLRDMNESNPLDRIVVVAPFGENGKYRVDFDGYIRELGLEHVSTQSFAEANFQIDLYRRPQL